MGFTADIEAFGWLKHARDGRRKRVRVNHKARGGTDKIEMSRNH
jgi:hypothetical protein